MSTASPKWCLSGSISVSALTLARARDGGSAAIETTTGCAPPKVRSSSYTTTAERTSSTLSAASGCSTARCEGWAHRGSGGNSEESPPCWRQGLVDSPGPCAVGEQTKQAWPAARETHPRRARPQHRLARPCYLWLRQHAFEGIGQK